MPTMDQARSMWEDLERRRKARVSMIGLILDEVRSRTDLIEEAIQNLDIDQLGEVKYRAHDLADQAEKLMIAIQEQEV